MAKAVAIVNEEQERVFSLLFEEDEITWQNIIYDLVQREQMNPWNIDISLLSQKFLEMLRKLKEMDFRISGKVVLAAALMLRLKSDKLVDEDILALDSLIASSEEQGDEMGDEMLDSEGEEPIPALYPRTPQPRKRKVSVYDLVKALEKAIEVEHRRKLFIPKDVEVKIPEKKMDISKVIGTVYLRIKTHFNNKKTKDQKLTFSQLIPSDSKQDKILTFVPLLHLETQRKIDMLQEQHFGEIGIQLATPVDVDALLKEQEKKLAEAGGVEAVNDEQKKLAG